MIYRDLSSFNASSMQIAMWSGDVILRNLVLKKVRVARCESSRVRANVIVFAIISRRSKYSMSRSRCDGE